ncbi:hypothetical protein [Geomonas silvestris]|uniref:hypothetical protein n=1 Tax=Geomonas silvestris TaxID=2740184 RepID=UPI001FE439EE|nr:hypothetical protein [Geomonas silvestris]
MEYGVELRKQFSGKFNLRVPPAADEGDLHDFSPWVAGSMYGNPPTSLLWIEPEYHHRVKYADLRRKIGEYRRRLADRDCSQPGNVLFSPICGNIKKESLSLFPISLLPRTNK